MFSESDDTLDFTPNNKDELQNLFGKIPRNPSIGSLKFSAPKQPKEPEPPNPSNYYYLKFL